VPSNERAPLNLGRLWDVLAILIIAFAAWKLLIAPRSFAPPVHPAPHAVYPLLAGGTFRVADQRGHVVFLDFFATWCEPCKIELPLVESWRHAHRDAILVPVDVGESRAAVSAFARRYALANVALDLNDSAPALFGVQGLPTIVAIDASGKIRAKWEGLNPAIGLALSNAQSHLSQ